MNNQIKLSSNIAELLESGTMEFFSRVKQMQQQGYDLISLVAGELDCPSPRYICDAGLKAINDGFTRYTLNNGILELREAIAEKLKNENSLNYSPEQILVSNGAKQTLFNLIFTTCGESDEVIIFSPYYPSYPELVKIARAKVVVVPTLPEENYQIDRIRLNEAINRKTRLIIINSPHNPTGTVYSRESIKIISDIVSEYKLWLLSDEIYEKIVYQPNIHYSPAQLFPDIIDRTMVVNGFSKTFAMTGWRIGYCAGPEEIIKKAALIQSHTTSNASSISQKAALAALNNGNNFINELLPALEKKKELAMRVFNSINELYCPNPGGAFYLFPSVKQFIGRKYGDTLIKSSEDIAMYLLNQKKAAVVPGTSFGVDDSIRISYATDIELLEKGCQRIKEGLELLE